MISQPADSSFQVVCGQNSSGQPWVPMGTQPWTGLPSMAGTLTPSPQSLQLGQFRHTGEPQEPPAHISGVWEETGVRGENPRRRGENVQTPHWQWLRPRTDFFPPYYNKQTEEKVTLFEDWLYCERVSEAEDDTPVASAGVSRVPCNYTRGSWTVLSHGI